MVSGIGSLNNFNNALISYNSISIQDAKISHQSDEIIDEYIPSLKKTQDYSLDFDKLDKFGINSFNDYVIARNIQVNAANIVQDYTIQNPNIDYKTEFENFLKYKGCSDATELQNSNGSCSLFSSKCNTENNILYKTLTNIKLRNPLDLDVNETFSSLLSYIDELNSYPELSLSGTPEQITDNLLKMLQNIKEPDENISNLISLMDKYKEQLANENKERSNNANYNVDYNKYVENSRKLALSKYQC